MQPTVKLEPCIRLHQFLDFDLTTREHPNSLFIDNDGDLYLARTGDDPIEFKPCTVREALNWYAETVELSQGWLGSIGIACRMAVEIMAGEREDSYAKFTERTRAVITGDNPKHGVILPRS